MREIRIEKVTLNIGVGEPGEKLEKAVKLLEMITGKKAIKTKAKRRIPEFNIREGLEIGAKVTLRKQEAFEILKKLFKAVDNKIEISKFDERANLSFGIEEYIHIPGVKYDPNIGIIGLSVCITFERPGFRIKRKRMSGKISKKHMIKKEEVIDFLKKNFGVEVIQK
ncbi:MAG: 50S ribosomal protein L5 [Candidatus Parvarchaeota archaeon]|nr:50S ribosomal protein L5 [Candidatus Jingweiarchaeum tengchongense]MCW1297791.1 50S ribosomal protein L5 [Candidatus Jingweiarchaeum tengchongense]MCW1299801.1 50S ribosomal protein L5 [Candidatus Jingweiarchaeum tengchongense]MCW1304228.1 50S ribosomal protein L5 [Candidatus Jingweiarchaeum tengchongense]MCW1305256.1 50S ribosomal protein L5 [Candidatus Jingweiarchaeum tengchongense]